VSLCCAPHSSAVISKSEKMHLVMFDIDGTLVESFGFDAVCFKDAILDVLNTKIDDDWDKYDHVTDSGILNQIIDEINNSGDRELVIASVKNRFIERVSDYLEQNSISPIQGASEFLSHLMARQNVKLAMATGGWLEPAQIKLKAAGFNICEIPIASSSDHFSRVEIMKIAESRCGVFQYESKTYFGDGPWDLKASEALGYNFIAVGARVAYSPSIQDYTKTKEIMNYIGL
jgi:phosphoglycolate phosphatase-like HAD superfamily hydrolase